MQIISVNLHSDVSDHKEGDIKAWTAVMLIMVIDLC